MDLNSLKKLIPKDNSYAESIFLLEPVREAGAAAICEVLCLCESKKCLDVGSGIGLRALNVSRLAEAESDIVGIDISETFTKTANLISKSVMNRGSALFVCGDALEMPFEESSFDSAWSSDFIGYGTENTTGLLEELSRVVKKGGRICVSAWSSQFLLPGYPFLEASLNATTEGLAPYTMQMNPDTHFMKLPKTMACVGINNIGMRTVLSEFIAPLTEDISNAIAHLFEMRWPKSLATDSSLSGLYETLCNPNSPGFIVNDPFYCCFFTETLFYGTVSK